MVRVRELPWDGVVEGLGEAVAMPLPDGPLEGCVDRALARVRGQRAESDESRGCLLVPGGTALGPGALSAAMRLGEAEGVDCRIRLGGRLGELLEALALGGEPVELVYLARGAAQSPESAIEGAKVVLLDPLERRIPMEVVGESMELPLSDRVILPVRHWVQLLWADLLLMGPHLWHTLLSGTPALAGLRLAWAAMRSLSTRPERLAAKLCQIGAGAQVHPSAVVEASVLGAGARIGAGAVVRGCVLGAGARVEELALCEGVVLAPGAVVQRQAMIKYGVLGPEAMIGGVTQLSVFGAGAALKRGAYGMDQSLSGRVRVRAGERLVNAPLGLAGVCLGPRALVGCGVRIAPGRVVPAGSSVAAPGALTRPEELEPSLTLLRAGKGSDS